MGLCTLFGLTSNHSGHKALLSKSADCFSRRVTSVIGGTEDDLLYQRPRVSGVGRRVKILNPKPLGTIVERCGVDLLGALGLLALGLLGFRVEGGGSM